MCFIHSYVSNWYTYYSTFMSWSGSLPSSTVINLDLPFRSLSRMPTAT